MPFGAFSTHSTELTVLGGSEAFFGRGFSEGDARRCFPGPADVLFNPPGVFVEKPLDEGEVILRKFRDP